jgi:hypothetical protein
MYIYPFVYQNYGLRALATHPITFILFPLKIESVSTTSADRLVMPCRSTRNRELTPPT